MRLINKSVSQFHFPEMSLL